MLDRELILVEIGEFLKCYDLEECVDQLILFYLQLKNETEILEIMFKHLNMEKVYLKKQLGKLV